MCENFEDFPKNFHDQSKADCYTYWALNKSDASICDKIEVGDKADCILFVAIETKNISLCNRLLWDNKKSCEDKVNCRLHPIECGIAECKSETNIYTRSQCFSDMAYDNDNITICNYVEDSNEQLNCITKCFLTKTGRTKPTLSSCSQLNNSKSQDMCLYNLATDNRNISICQHIKDGYQKTSCEDAYFFTIARDTKNASYCQQIKDDVYKKSCLKYYAD